MPSRTPPGSRASVSRAHDKLRSTLPKVPGVSRRQQFSASTKRALVDIAEQMFSEHGYTATSLDAIVSGARVTKGALYHHFSGKQALFEAVFEKVEAEASSGIRQALRRANDPWEKASVGLSAFLEVVRDPTYQRVVIQDGPAVLGYERFREQEERSSYGLVQEMARQVLESSQWDLSPEMLDTFSRIFFGALSAAGETVTTAAEPEVAVAQVKTAMSFILAGLRALSESGVEVADPADFLDEDEQLDASGE